MYRCYSLDQLIQAIPEMGVFDLPDKQGRITPHNLPSILEMATNMHPFKEYTFFGMMFDVFIFKKKQ